MLRKKAAEELKKEQERKAAERRRIIEQRCGRPRDLQSANEGTLKNYYWTIKSFSMQFGTLQVAQAVKNFSNRNFNLEIKK